MLNSIFERPSMLGALHVVTCHRVGDNVILDSFSRSTFNHTSGFTAIAKSVVKNDVTGTVDDSYTVKLAYPEGDEPNDQQSRFEVLLGAWEAINELLDSELFGTNKIA
jgi:hypothetical protein